jgi:hypothetical protein
MMQHREETFNKEQDFQVFSLCLMLKLLDGQQKLGL